MSEDTSEQILDDDRSLSEAARSSELNEAEVVEAGALRTES